MLSAAGQRWLSGVLVALCVVPFAVLAFSSHPSLDDFGDAVLRQRLGFWESQVKLYHTWTGRFTTSVLLTEASPLRHSSWPFFYFLVAWSTLLAVAVALFTLLTATTGRAWTTRARVLASGILLSLWLAQAPSVAECLYWYNGVAVYTLPDVLFLLWLAALAKLVPRPASSWGYVAHWSTTAFLSVAVVGSNEILALLALATLGVVLVWARRCHSAHFSALLGIAVVAVVATAVAFLAPGNQQRLAIINRALPPVGSAVGAVASAVYLSINWLGDGLLLTATALSLPALVRLVEQRGTLAHRVQRVHPLAMAAGLLVLLVLAGIPSYGATGGMMPMRARTAVYLLFLVGWLALVLAGLGWARRHWPGQFTVPAVWSKPMAAALWGVLLLTFVTDHNVRVTRAQAGVGSNNVVLAYRDWLSGAAGRYDADLTARYRTLRGEPGRRLQLPPLTIEPPTLLYSDITTDSTYWANVAYARYFGQRAVWIGLGGHVPQP